MKKAYLLFFLLSSTSSIFSQSGNEMFNETARDTVKDSCVLDEKEIDYEIFMMEHNKKVFEWELFSTKVFFWLSIFLVIVGITLSILQFIKSSHQINSNSESTIILSEKGFQLKTAFIGLILLIISFGYLYLYMKTAYPVKYIEDEYITQPREQDS